MNSITQELLNETQKIIKKCFFTVCKSILNPFLNNSVNDFSNTAYINFMLNLNSNLNEVVIKTLQMAIPQIDEYFLNSNYRKLYFYKGSIHNRSITLLFGDLNYERIYYTDKNKKNGFYLIDELFNFEKNTTYDPLVRAIFIDNAVNTNANITSNKTNFILGDYKEYMKQNNFRNIPRQTVYRWIKKWNIPKVKYDYVENIKELYVMVDEKWIHETIRLAELSEEERGKHHFIMSKCFVTFTDAEVKNNRSKLLNRHIFMTTSNKPWQQFVDSIYNIYNFEEIENIYLLSDSGSWILAGKGELKLFSINKITVNTCEFHVKEYIRRLTKSKEKRKILIKSIYEDENKKAFTKLAEEIVSKSRNKKYKTSLKNYILNHWKTIINMKSRKIKSSMESHISHCIANHFGSRPKGFSRKRIEKYIKLEEYKHNGINIMQLYLSSYNKNNDDNFVYNQNKVSFSIFEKDTSVLPTRSPNNPLSILFHNVAYGY